MSKELVISANRHETRVALLEDDQLVEVYFQRANEYSLAGSIHKGRVTRVLPGMQSAFVDLGLERDTFLYVSDFLEEHEDIDRITGDERPPRERERRPPQAAATPIESVVLEPSATIADRAVEPSSERGPAPSMERGGGERPQDRGDDRRGRRSRRRRNRGRGIPDSKYAPEGSPRPTEAAVAGEAEPEHRFEEPVESSAPLILPGESLAKYQGATSEREAPALNGPVNLGAESHVLDIVENEFDEPLHYPPENAMPDAPAHLPELIASPEEVASVAVTPGLPDEEEAEEHAEEAAAEEIPVVAPLLDEEEDRDIQEMILSHADNAEDAGEEAEEPGLEVSDLATEPGAEPAEPESGSATVRERGGRYPHRGVSRRMRRRRGPGDQNREPHRDQPRDQPKDQPKDQPRDQFREQPRDQNREQNRGPAAERTVSRPMGPQISISDILKEGQEIIVQIAKEPLGQKGARITSHIALPGRYVVYMPTLEHMGVSRKISSDEERLRLKRVLQGRRPGPMGGFITRTAAEGRTEEEIAADMAFLYNLWQDIRAKAEKRPAPMLLHHDLDIVQRILRDQLADSFKAIWIDNEDAYESVLRFVERFQPALVGKVKLYTRDAPIFDAFSVTSELEKALRPKVWLKSGGYIVINQTEALVAIDVNTGKYVGKSNRLEDTIVKTNTEAIKEIVRQVRLRDLGGIIVIDFIDMDERKNRQKVMQVLEEAMRVDRAPYKILQFNDFGLVAITRKRVKQSLERTLCSPCPHCDGAGYIKSVQTVVSEILTEARKMASSVEGKEVMLRVHPDVAKLLKSHQNKYLEELEEILRRSVLVKSDPLLHHEKFDLA